MDKEDMQKRFMEYQMIHQKVKEMQEQMEQADGQLVEIMATIQSLDEFNEVEDGTEILVPINNGIFAKATLKKDDKLRVNVGSAVVVDKSLDETKGLIQKQLEELNNVRMTMAANAEMLTKRATELEKELTAAAENV